MREIKFRAWDGEKMVDCWTAAYHTSEWPVNAIFEKTYGHTYMQYTGLKDKNGVEIYEGDIIRYLGYEVKGGKQVHPERQLAIGNDWIKDCYLLKNISEQKRSLEVIGNIYETPEKLD